MTREEIDTLWQQALQKSAKQNGRAVHDEFANLVAAHEREVCINKIKAEIEHSLLNNHRLELKFGQARGDRAVRMSALEASLDWLRDRGEKP